MYSMKQVCEKTGLSAHTLRYYEKEGMLHNIKRTTGGNRSYTDEDLETISLICCLKNTGMPQNKIAHFIHLTTEGEQTLRERCDILIKHKEYVLEQMNEMQTHLDKVSWKIGYYSQLLKKYESQE